MNFDEDEDAVLDHLERSNRGERVPPSHHTEDDEPRSRVFKKGMFTGVSFPVMDAASQAGLSFLGGAPRNPNLLPGEGSEYSVVRTAEGEFAFTKITRSKVVCNQCGRQTLVAENVNFVDDTGTWHDMGQVAACSRCDSDHWFFTKHLVSERYRPYDGFYWLVPVLLGVLFVCLIAFAGR